MSTNYEAPHCATFSIFCDMFHNRLEFLWWELVSPLSNPQAGGPTPVGCLQLLLQYIRSYPPYLEAISSICNLRAHHAMVTGNPLNMELSPSTDI
jgi:hypothetical protein